MKLMLNYFYYARSSRSTNVFSPIVADHTDGHPTRELRFKWTWICWGTHFDKTSDSSGANTRVEHESKNVCRLRLCNQKQWSFTSSLLHASRIQKSAGINCVSPHNRI